MLCHDQVFYQHPEVTIIIIIINITLVPGSLSMSSFLGRLMEKRSEREE